MSLLFFFSNPSLLISFLSSFFFLPYSSVLFSLIFLSFFLFFLSDSPFIFSFISLPMFLLFFSYSPFLLCLFPLLSPMSLLFLLPDSSLFISFFLFTFFFLFSIFPLLLCFILSSLPFPVFPYSTFFF